MVWPGIAGTSPRAPVAGRRPPGWAVSPGVSCCSGTLTRSLRTPRWVRGQVARAPGRCRWKMSKSLLASHGGSIAGVKACTNGCMSVEDRSCFSYQVAAGKHDVGQQRGRGHPEVGARPAGRACPPGASSRQVTSSDEPRRSGSSLPSTLEWVPSRCLQEVLVALGRGAEQVGAPQHQRARPVLRGVDVLDRRAAGVPSCSASATYAGGVRRACRRRRRPRPRRRGPAGCGRTAGRTASSPAARTGRWCPRCACRPGGPRPAARRARRRSSRRCATGRCACTSTTVPIMVRGGRDQSSALAREIQPVIGRHFSWPT